MKYCWSLLALQLLIVNGVFGDDTDEIKSVIEGDSVTLHINVENMESDLIGWYFEAEANRTRIAQINGKADSMRVYDDVLDGRFKDRLELNITTGSLTIRNITTEHSGLYTLRITNKKVSYKTFNVTVNVSIIIIIITVCLSAVLIVIISAVIYFRKHRLDLKGLIKVQTSETEERRLEDKDQQQV
ncbi:uncharacterized protein LOC127642185 isoform X3 [Xyrauchen texanus]|uniref:uncharacterized protein LOC127642185 isoform X3 n=1 Tax=Xyrauchen texanus TaxID=154827 RepID=UPI002242C326|nr:uncharacterized protein LOC127642185 isoform X3 [Xyrauchen texanus]